MIARLSFARADLFACLALTALCLVTACGKNDSPNAPEAPSRQTGTPDNNNTPAVIEPQNVATTDEPIVLPSPATGLAFWEHPALPFEGMVIAATRNGVFAHTLEGDGAVTVLFDIEASGAAIAYFPASIRGQSDDIDTAAQGILVTYDLANGAYRFFSIDNISRTLNEGLFSLPMRPQIGEPVDFCLIPSRLDDQAISLQLVSLEKNIINVYTFERGTPSGPFDQEWSIRSEGYPTQLDAIACAYDHLSDKTFILDSAGMIHDFAIDSGNAAALFSTGLTNPGGLALHRSEVLGPDGITRQRQTLAISVDASSGIVRMIDLDNGDLVGAVRLSAFDVNEGVINTSAIGVASGNFGGLYRSGALALGAVSAPAIVIEPEDQQNDSGDEAPRENVNAVRLTPFIAIANGFNLNIEATIRDRTTPDQAGFGTNPAVPEISIDLDEINP